MSNQFALPAPEVQNTSGAPGSGWKLEFFDTGTLVNRDTYTDDALAVAHTNPVVADSRGQFAAIYLQARDYRVKLSDADDVEIWDIDPVRGGNFLNGDDLILDADRDTFLRTTTDDQIEVHIAGAKDFQFTANLFDVLSGSVIKVTGQLELAKGADVASAAALAVDIDGNIFDVTGTTAITSIASRGIGSVIVIHFDAALTLTHNATDLVLPGGANITTAAGDEAIFYEYAAGDWRCTNYQRAATRPDAGVFQFIMGHHGNDTTAGNTTIYLSERGNSTTENNIRRLAGQAFTVYGIHVSATVAPGAGQNIVFTLQKDNVATAVTVSLTEANLTNSSEVNEVSFTAGEFIDVEAAYSATAATSALAITLLVRAAS